MANEIEQLLSELRRSPGHPALDGIEDRILCAIDARRSEAVGSRMTLGLAVGALLIGIVGATVPHRAATASTAAAFADPGPLAPSSLLLGAGER